ncbi:hypothetical protein Tco_0663209 [Tanacetum coccineum]
MLEHAVVLVFFCKERQLLIHTWNFLYPDPFNLITFFALYVVSTGKDNFIVSVGRPNMVPARRTIVSPGSIIFDPGEPHSTAVKTILKYLRNTKDMFLVYDRNPEAELRVDFYCNAGFEINRDEIKSQT